MRWRALPERLVRPLFVVLTAPGVELSLLRVGVFGRGGEVFFERQMRALEAAILLRRAWLDSLERMPSCSHRIESRVGPAAPAEAKGGPLSDAHRERQPEFLESRVEDPLDCLAFGIENDLAAQEVPAPCIKQVSTWHHSTSSVRNCH
jgi:hypothetical protein